MLGEDRTLQERGSRCPAELAAGAALVLVFFAMGATFAGELTGGTLLTIGDIVVLALLPLALTLLATWVARTAVLAALRETL